MTTICMRNFSPASLVETETVTVTESQICERSSSATVKTNIRSASAAVPFWPVPMKGWNSRNPTPGLSVPRPIFNVVDDWSRPSFVQIVAKKQSHSQSAIAI